jgi:hypothetical protein
MLITITSSIFSPAAHAQTTKDKIRAQAEAITLGVDSSLASEAELLQALLKLREASAILGLDTTQPTPQLFCEPINSLYSYLVRAQDGYRFGSGSVSHTLCRQLASQARNGMVCGPQNSLYATIYNISSGLPLGESVDNTLCGQVISRSTRQFVCAPSNSLYGTVTRIATGETIGSSVRLEQCYQTIQQ